MLLTFTTRKSLVHNAPTIIGNSESNLCLNKPYSWIEHINQITDKYGNSFNFPGQLSKIYLKYYVTSCVALEYDTPNKQECLRLSKGTEIRTPNVNQKCKSNNSPYVY